MPTRTTEVDVIRCRTILFDLFHTLTGGETERDHLPSTISLLGVERQDWNRVLLERSRWRLVGEVRDPLLIMRSLAHTIDPSITEERIIEATRVRLQRFADSLRRAPPENIDTLSRLRAAGLRLGLISNADAAEVAAWSESPLARCFDATVFSCDVGHAKPEPEIYRECLARLDTDAADGWFVGDGGSHELAGARAVGLRSVLMSGVIAELWPEMVPARRADADLEISALPELLEHLGLTCRSR